VRHLLGAVNSLLLDHGVPVEQLSKHIPPSWTRAAVTARTDPAAGQQLLSTHLPAHPAHHAGSGGGGGGGGDGDGGNGGNGGGGEGGANGGAGVDAGANGDAGIGAGVGAGGGGADNGGGDGGGGNAGAAAAAAAAGANDAADADDATLRSPRFMQAKLTALANKQLRARFLASLNRLPNPNQASLTVAQETRPQAHARFLSQLGRGAGSYLTARPASGMDMQPWHMTMALRRHLGHWTTLADGHCPWHPPASADREDAADRLASTHHAVTCPLTGLQNTLHHDMTAAVIEVLRRAHIYTVSKEDTTCFDGAAASNSNLRMDVVIPIGAVRGANDRNIRDKRILCDITVANPSAKYAIRRHHTDTRAGALAAAKEDFKRQHYNGTFIGAISTLVPFAIETYGRLGSDADHFIKELAAHTANATDQHKSQLLCKWRQLISVSLQCAVSRRELRYVQKLRARQLVAERPEGAQPQTVRPIEHMWDLIADDAATAAPDAGAAHGPGRRGGARARGARQH